MTPQEKGDEFIGKFSTLNDAINEYELVGWMIQERWKSHFGQMNEWRPQSNRKLYRTEKIADEALVLFGEGYMPNHEYRKRPIYAKKLNSEQNVQVSDTTEVK